MRAPPSEAQLRYIGRLTALLQITLPEPVTSHTAAQMIDGLRLLAEAHPDIVPCAEPGGDFWTNRTRRRAHTYCHRHRAMPQAVDQPMAARSPAT